MYQKSAKTSKPEQCHATPLGPETVICFSFLSSVQSFLNTGRHWRLPAAGSIRPPRRYQITRLSGFRICAAATACGDDTRSYAPLPQTQRRRVASPWIDRMRPHPIQIHGLVPWSGDSLCPIVFSLRFFGVSGSERRARSFLRMCRGVDAQPLIISKRGSGMKSRQGRGAYTSLELRFICARFDPLVRATA